MVAGIGGAPSQCGRKAFSSPFWSEIAAVMKFWLAFLIALAPALACAQTGTLPHYRTGPGTSQEVSPTTPFPSKSLGNYAPLGFCQITSLASAVSLVTASCATGSVPTGATIAEICVEAAGIRYRDDGTAPTTTVGIPVEPTSTSPICFAYAVNPLSNMQLIAISGSPVVNALFYK